MTAHLAHTSSLGEALACEAARYLDVVDVFAGCGADPHAAKRARAAQARQREDHSPATARTGVRRWGR
jgi:hypothetical protein